MASSLKQFEIVPAEERVLEIVRGLLSELGHESAVRAAGPGSRLEHDLGIGSLERVELLLRLEKAFGTRIDEHVLAGAETVQDLITAASGTRLADGRAATPVQAMETDARAAEVSATGRAHLPPAGRTGRQGRAEGIPAADTFQDVLRYRGRAEASRTHLIFYEDEGEGTSLTFDQLLEGAEHVAADLAQRGIGRSDSVALMLPTSREFFLVFAGTLLAGATPVPIYPPFRADRIGEYAERQSAILANASARLLVTFREAASVAKLLKPLVRSLEGVATADALVQSRAQAPLGPPVHARAEDLALLQYTSGSTGDPKGVMLTHANLLANVRAIGEAVGLRNDDVGVTWLPLYHDMGLIGSWLLPLYFGLPMVVLSPLAFLSRPVRWLRAFHRYRGTMGAAPNFAYELAAAKISDDDIQGLDLSAWRAALNGAEPVLPATLDRFAARFASRGFRRESLLPVYGLAEASLAVTIPPVGRGPRVDHLDRAALAQAGRAVPTPLNTTVDDASVISFVSVGQSIPGHEVRIVNDRGVEVGERIEGQLWFRGPSATQGYYRNDTATSDLFPHGATDGWVNSGDRAYSAEGEIYITGRVKDIIIRAGHNLYPHEIEDAAAQVTGIRKGCVVAFGAAGPSTGTERFVIVAESRERDRSARERIAQAIMERVTEALGMPPDVVEVIPPNVIPKTSSGKLRRDMTKQRFLAGELDAALPPVWLQVVRLAAASGAGRLRIALRRVGEATYGWYALAMFGLLLVPTWLLVLVSSSRESAARITKAAVRTYMTLAGWRVRVEGRENLRANAPRMFVANHTSYADILVVMAALGANYHFVAKAEVLSMPFVRTFVRKLGHYAFRREDPRARLEQADQIEEALRDGESVFVFAEGTFTAQAGVRPFHLGAFKAAVAARREVVPVALEGTRRALRDGTWLPRPEPITVTICPAISPGADAGNWKEIVRMRDAVREVIALHAHEPLL